MLITSAKSRTLRKIGFILFVVSFFTPNWEFRGMGINAFIFVPQMVCAKLLEGDFRHWRMIILLGSMSLGWLSNFSVFFQLPRVAAIIAMAAPWILFLAMVFLGKSTGADTKVIGFVPFYPWAIGIGIIHYSRWNNSPNFNRHSVTGILGP